MSKAAVVLLMVLMSANDAPQPGKYIFITVIFIRAGFGAELFSLPTADLACYAYAMVNRQDASYSPGSPEIRRRRLTANINFDGTKLAIERSRPKTTTDGRNWSSPLYPISSISRNRARRSLIRFHFGLDKREQAPEFWL